jgi:hypothetical protein
MSKCIWANVFWANDFWANVVRANVFLGKMSFWANVFLGQMSFWPNVVWANVLLGKRCMSKCLWANVSGQMSYGQMSWNRKNHETQSFRWISAGYKFLESIHIQSSKWGTSGPAPVIEDSRNVSRTIINSSR